MRLILIILLLSTPALAIADPLSAAHAAIDYDQPSALAARAKFAAAGLPLPCMACEAAWPAQKAALMAVQVSICEASYASSPEYSQACSAWWRTVLQ